MSRYLSAASLLTGIMLVLFGCGGGGGGGGGVEINYVGETEKIVLTTDNADEVGLIAHDATDPLTWVGDPDILERTPAAKARQMADRLALASSSPAAREAFSPKMGSCGGDETMFISESSARINIVYTNYCDEIDTGGFIWNGNLLATGSQSMSGGIYKLAVNMTFNVTINAPILTRMDIAGVEVGAIRGTVKMVLTGINAVKNYDGEGGYWYSYDTDEIAFKFNLLVHDGMWDYSVWLNNFTVATQFSAGMESTLTVDGRVYLSNHGYIDFVTATPFDLVGGAFGELVLEGAQNSALKLAMTPTNVWTAYLEAGDDIPPVFDDGIYPLTPL